MASNDPPRESEDESDVQQALDGEWHEQQNTPVTVLTDTKEDSQSSARVSVLEPESDEKEAVALAVESQNEDHLVKIDVDSALVLSDKLGQVAERVSSKVGR
ncbi:hypothetical protein C2R22_04980 [Salinigranum rubrum]|uniref:Uncharacterized protein n=1 Tax=Salinigranum rubrum TaxID=755307 RepID=A0A2I8VGP2_9EURY|nr:hypothetical protein [Salinigranum rubrum]AUV81092.1 hypothetical protein C2R22_04980 [Salinigranum rubrum]